MSSHSTSAGESPVSGIPAMLANSAWQIVATAGVAAVVLGVLVLVWPGATLVLVGTLFGIYLLISGAFQIAGAFGNHVPGHLRALGLLSGALSVLLGLICFRGPMESILLLAIWIGFGWLLRGIMQVSVAMSSDVLPARGWQITFGVIGVIAGIVLITSPITSIATLTLLAGIWLVVLGLFEVVHAVQLRSRLRS
ncbi:MAG TPA: HdeD family acid-resistance protein [Pseudonocardiaceae bacterium]|jgi:uncharacterized membrane protein HdeD (DUF308 family)|nr:HdeD family acid-resistance protein [Pseudonocardiaceae bacterium]